VSSLLAEPAVATPAPVEPRSVRGRALVPVLLFLGMVVSVISSLGAPLIPTIATDYQVTQGAAQWSLTIALLVGAVTAPIMGRLGDGPHRRQVILSMLGLVMLGCALAALPLSFAALLAGRGLQGIGLGLMPLAMTVARDHLPAERSRSAVAVLSITASAGVGLGYPLTGLLADGYGFHAPFWFGVAISALALGLAAAVVPGSSHLQRRPLDGIGAVLLSAGLIGLLLCLSEGGSWGWTSDRLLALALVTVLALGTWVWHELRTSFPLVNLRLMSNRSVLTANATSLLAGLGMYMLLPMVTRYVQVPTSTGYGFGTSVVVAGLVLLPFSVASVLASRLMPVIARRLSRFLVLPLGSLALVGSMLIFLFDRAHLADAFLIMGVAGLGVGLTFAAIPGLIVRSVPAEETGSALGVNQVLRQIGFSIGSALGATILTAHTVAPDTLPTSAGYTVSALVGVVLCLFAAVVSFVLPSRQTSPSTVDRAEERMLVDESVDGTAGGVMLLDTESPESDPRRSDPRRPVEHNGNPAEQARHGRHRPSPWRVPVGEPLPA
jgi:predicted MFS family arabinose efflux permease